MRGGYGNPNYASPTVKHMVNFVIVFSITQYV